MKPKEKAKELVDKYKFVKFQKGKTSLGFALTEINAKQCALICIEEILNDNPNIYDSDRLNHNYWKEVKDEIEKL